MKALTAETQIEEIVSDIRSREEELKQTEDAISSHQEKLEAIKESLRNLDKVAAVSNDALARYAGGNISDADLQQIIDGNVVQEDKSRLMVRAEVCRLQIIGEQKRMTRIEFDLRTLRRALWTCIFNRLKGEMRRSIRDEDLMALYVAALFKNGGHAIRFLDEVFGDFWGNSDPDKQISDLKKYLLERFVGDSLMLRLTR